MPLIYKCQLDLCANQTFLFFIFYIETKRFRIVRNGRAEITNPQVRNVSVANLAERELTRDDETQQDNESRELEVSLCIF